MLRILIEGSLRKRGPLSRQHGGFAGFEFRCRRSILARSSTDFVAGAAFSCFWHGRIANPIGTDAQGGARRFRGRGSIFARSGTHFVAGAAFSQRSSTDFVAGAAFSQGQVCISWQGAAFSQGQVQISWQAQQFRKVRYRFRGRRNTFVIEGTITFFQLLAKVKYKSSIRSTLLQLQLENGRSQVQK